MSYLLGSLVPLSVTVKDSTGTPVAATVAVTITAPDGTTSTPAPSTSTTGVYFVDYPPTLTGRHRVLWSITGAVTASYGDVFEVDSPAVLPICSLADIKAHLNLPASYTTDDAEMLNMALAISDQIESGLGYPLRLRTITEKYDGGVDAIALRTTPCPCQVCAQYSALSVTTVVENSVTLAQGTDYVVDLSRGMLRRGQFGGLYGYNWVWIYAYAQGVVVTYTTGYKGIPPWARQAFLRAMANSWQRTQQRPHPGVAQAPMSDEMPARNPDALPSHVLVMLQRHKGGAW